MTTATARAAAPTSHPSDPSAGGRLVATDGRTLPLRATRIAAIAEGGLARVVLSQVFQNPHAEPLRVTYLFPLPHDGAVSGFAFTLGGRRVVGEVDRLQAARRRFEEALVEGRTAGLVEEVRGSVFRQELGNVPPGAEVVAELTVDQPLAWLPEGAWSWRFPTAVAPRYQGATGRTPDAGRLTVEVAEDGVPARLSLSLEVRDRVAAGGALASPTHALRTAGAADGLVASFVAEGGAPLDRDVTVTWPVAGAEVGVALAHAAAAGARLAGRAFGLVTVTPPATRALAGLPRDLVVLLDTSGSMSGRPLDRARGVIGALVDSLGEGDRLELVEFSDEARRWQRGAVPATAANRQAARTWLAGLEAGGCTEMTDGLLEALRPLRAGAQRQVVLVTDGEIGFEAEVIRAVMERLPSGSRLHTVGIGSAVNRSLTAPTARAGRGVEVLVDLDEDVAKGAARLLARMVAPAVTELELSGDALVGCAPARLPDLFGGAPALLPVELAPRGGTLTLRGRTATGPFARTLQVPAAAAAEAPFAARFGRELVEDLELRAAAGEALDGEIEAAGLAFQISTRRTSWVAISAEATVDPRQPTRNETMPQALPYGMSVEGLGLRAGASTKMAVACAMSVAPSMDFEAEEAMQLSAGELLADLRRSAPPPAPPPAASPRADAPLGGAEKKKEHAARMPPKRRRGAARAIHLAARVNVATSSTLVIEADVSEPLFWLAYPEVVLVLGDGTELTLAVDLDRTTAEGRLAAGTTIRLVLRLEAPLPSGVALLRIEPDNGLVLELEAP